MNREENMKMLCHGVGEDTRYVVVMILKSHIAEFRIRLWESCLTSSFFPLLKTTPRTVSRINITK